MMCMKAATSLTLANRGQKPTQQIPQGWLHRLRKGVMTHGGMGYAKIS